MMGWQRNLGTTVEAFSMQPIISDELRKVCLDADLERLDKFLKSYGCRLIDHAEITGEVPRMMNNRGENWPWVEKWASEDALAWVNDLQTLVFEIPLASLTGLNCLNFTQEVLQFQTSLFEHQTWGNRMFVRMYWDDQSSHTHVMRLIKLAQQSTE
jgi:hypothetical protein